MLSLIQPYTIDSCQLDGKAYTKEVVPARELLHVSRFDLFAKLYYARNREQHRQQALEVYVQHIRAFNNCQEPGNDDKVTAESFIDTFDQLLDHFKEHEFDESISLVPVDEKGMILDGAHRVTALAYYGKSVTILRFSGVKTTRSFDYEFFMRHGLSWSICDLIANEMAIWRDDILAACMWPSLGSRKSKDQGVAYLSGRYDVCYKRDMRDGLKTLRIVVMQSDLTVDETAENKERLRGMIPSGAHSVEMTEKAAETRALLPTLLTQEGQAQWRKNTAAQKWMERIDGRWYYFREKQWVIIKIGIVRTKRRVLSALHILGNK